MNAMIVSEVQLFFSAAAYGAVLAICYDQLRVLRTLMHHSVPAVDAEDILFFLTAGLGFFGLLYSKNEGILRWYAFFGCGLGCISYEKTAGPFVRRFEVVLLRLLFYPVAVCCRKMEKIGNKRTLQKQEKRIKMKAEKAEKAAGNSEKRGQAGKTHESEKTRKKKRT